MTIRTTLLLLLIYFFASSCKTSSTFGYSKKAATDTIKTLNDHATSDLVAFKAPNNKIYYARRVPAAVADSSGEMPTSTMRLLEAATTDPAIEQFRDGQGGGVREEAKTTFASGPFTKRSIRWLVRNLPSNDSMATYHLGQTSPRCAPEKKNVHVRTAYIYVFKHEDDKDYHLLIGNKKNYEDADYIFNAEVSGLPVNFSQDLAQLTKVRKDAVDFFKTKKSCSSQDYILSIPIEIKGSLFYDYHHKSETAKCKGIQANTAWEIHPVHSITFK